DPILSMAGEERDPQVLEFLLEKYRLNDPVPYQYVRWLGAALQGDLVISLRTNQPVLQLVGAKPMGGGRGLADCRPACGVR
ncbi:hypothetical protein ACCS64_39375, partial [Rhizobium ruizarguesonis]